MHEGRIAGSRNETNRDEVMMIHSWDDIVRILIMGTSAYVALVFLLRISGKRTLSKMNAFDFVVTVALGSTLATVFLDKSISLFEGISALALLVALQFVITWLSVRVKWIDALVKSEPTLIASEGQYLISSNAETTRYQG